MALKKEERIVIIGAKCLNSVLQEMKQNSIDLNQLSSKELGRLFNSYLSVGAGRKFTDPDLLNPKRK